MHLRSYSTGGTTKFLTWTWITAWRCLKSNWFVPGPKFIHAEKQLL